MKILSCLKMDKMDKNKKHHYEINYAYMILYVIEKEKKTSAICCFTKCCFTSTWQSQTIRFPGLLTQDKDIHY